jgi:hypothetical protein
MAELTEGWINLARQDKSHVGIKVLDSFPVEYWTDLIKSFEGKEAVGCQAECHGAVTPYAERLEGQNFTLNPLEIVSVWNRVLELLPITPRDTLYARYDIASALSFAYATAPINSKEWKGLFAKKSKDSRYLERLIKEDPQNREIYDKRLCEVLASLEQIDIYKLGEKKDETIERYKRIAKGDEEAKRKSEEIRIIQASKDKDGFLAELSENWGNGISMCNYSSFRG